MLLNARMRAIFLDIEGVLNNGIAGTIRYPLARDADRSEPMPCFHAECVERFNRLIRQSGAQVVISATWGRPFSLDSFRQHLRSQQVCCDVIGQTPTRPTWRPRGYDIDDWLTAWDGETVDAFCILDDHEDMMHLKRYLVQTDYRIGMQENHVHEALTLLMR